MKQQIGKRIIIVGRLLLIKAIEKTKIYLKQLGSLKFILLIQKLKVLLRYTNEKVLGLQVGLRL